MMDWYSLIKPCLFQFEPECAHQLAMKALAATPACLLPQVTQNPVTCMGLSFPNRVGLAAGFDKNGEHLSALAKLGFGFIEVGTVTPKPQIGNPKPRVFRVPKQRSLINRMGFNSKGVDYLVSQIKSHVYKGVLGVNIGKNKETPLESAHEDYVTCLEKVYPYADYITVNISSPNTPGLRLLQQAEVLHDLLSKVKQAHTQSAEKHNKRVPLLVKLSPDENEEALNAIAEVLVSCDIDAVVATNTTVNHQDIQDEKLAAETGGVSGALLTARAQQVVRHLVQQLQGKMPVIAVGGIMTNEDAAAYLAAGASLIQVYSGFIYGGPIWLHRLMQAISVPPK